MSDEWAISPAAARGRRDCNGSLEKIFQRKSTQALDASINYTTEIEIDLISRLSCASVIQFFFFLNQSLQLIIKIFVSLIN